MGVPSQVDEAAELAEKLHSEMFGTQPEEDTEEEKEEELEEEDSAEDEEVDEEEEVDDEDDVPHDDDVEDLRKFKARYLSLKGKYDAEVPRLQHELSDLKQNVFEKLTSISENPAQTKQEEKQDKDLIAQLKEEYGEEFIEGIAALVEQSTGKQIKSSLSSVEDKVSSVEETQIKVAQENFMSYLDTKVDGDWRALWEGKDKKFIDFLGKPDPSGLYTYGDLVQMYNDAWDADKLATVINTYLGEKPVKKEKASSERDALVAPSRSSAHTAPKADDKIIWTQDAIKEFQKQDRQGKLTAEESQAKWNDLLSAPAEGRIR